MTYTNFRGDIKQDKTKSDYPETVANPYDLILTKKKTFSFQQAKPK